MEPKALKVAPNNIIDKLSLLLVRDRKVMFARSASQPVIFYCLGGKRDAKPEGGYETDIEALIRECLEEANIRLDEQTISFAKVFEGGADGIGYVPGTITRLTCYFAETNDIPVASREIAELTWFTSADGHRTTPLGREILQWLHEADLID